MENISYEMNSIYQKHQRALFLIDAEKEKNFSFSEFFFLASQLSSFLDCNLPDKKPIAVCMHNSIETAIVYFAALLSEITVVPINPLLFEDDILYILNDSQVEFTICHSSVQESTLNLFSKKIVVQDFLFSINSETYITLNPSVSINTNEIKPFSFENTFVPIITYTSGTTSTPKGIIHTIENIVSNAILFKKALNLDSNTRFISLLSMTYLGGYYNLLIIPYVCNASIVIVPSFNASTILNFWENIIKYQVNTLWISPTIANMLLSVDRDEKGIRYCKDSNLRFIVGMAPLLSSTKEKFFSKYNHNLIENYALSETLFISTNTGDISTNHQGFILDGIEIQIRDIKTNKILKTNEEGIIYVKTPYLMKSYKNKEELFKQHFFNTGDIGYVTTKNSLVVTGREKDIIIRGGLNISPSSIENLILKHQNIAECAVIGIKDEILGEKIIAIIKIKDMANFETIKNELQELYFPKLPATHKPAKILNILSFPYTYSGKIQKNKLRTWAEDYCASPLKIEQSSDISTNYYKPSLCVQNIIEATSVKFNMMVYDLKQKNVDVTVLSLGEAFFDIPLFDFNELPYPDIYHYGSSKGLLALRETLSKYYMNKYDVSINSATEIIITAGSKLAVYMSLVAFIDPGDEIIVFEPAWVSYTEQIKMCNGTPITIPYDENLFNCEKYISNKTKVIIINNPQNPSGKIYTLDELTFLYKLAEKHGLFILSDEAYSDFILEKDKFISFGNIDPTKKHTIICNSISKNCGISGWRIGYIIANQDITKEILKLNQHLMTCAPTILEFYMAKHFDTIIEIIQPQIKNLLLKRQSVLLYLDSLGLLYLAGNSTFYIFVSIEDSNITSEEFCLKLLYNKHIATVPGIGYGKSCDKYIRISIGTESLERIFQALNEIKSLILENKG